jgi:zinc/manganese transport system permease protein
MTLGLLQPFADYTFMQRALVGCIALSLGAPPVGVFLVLRRLSLTADAMQHAILPGVAVGYLLAGLSLSAMTLGGAVAGLAVAGAAGVVTRGTVLREDASLAAFYLMSLALGVLIVSLRGSGVDLLHILFGSILALDDAALVMIGAITTLSLIMLALIYRPLVLECLDPGFLRSVSRTGGVTHFAFLALLVLNLVGGFNALGTLLAVGLMLLPAIAARFWCADIAGLLIVSSGLAMLSSGLGLLLSFHADLPTGPAIILVCGVVYILSLLFGRRGGLLMRNPG